MRMANDTNTKTHAAVLERMRDELLREADRLDTTQHMTGGYAREKAEAIQAGIEALRAKASAEEPMGNVAVKCGQCGQGYDAPACGPTHARALRTLLRAAERYKTMRDICVDALEESYRREAGELFHSNWRGRLKYHLFDDADVRLILESHGTEQEKKDFEAFRQRRHEALEAQQR